MTMRVNIAGDVGKWDEAHAAYVSGEGANASERLLRRADAVRQMHDIEAAYEDLPGGFRAERARFKDHIKKIVDGMPALTDDQLVKLVQLLR